VTDSGQIVSAPASRGTSGLLVEARELSKTYRPEGPGAAVHALRSATLTLRRGEFACLLGPSGSGKSTLLHLLGGLLTPTGGGLRVAGVDLVCASRAERAQLRRRQLGFVFPSDNLSPLLRLRENVELALALRGRDSREAAVLLGRLGLAELGGRFPETLSTGEAQRGAVARAVAGDPALLLADEPTAHLDGRAAAALIDLLLEIHHAGRMALLLATHDERLIRPATRRLRLEDGRLVEGGA